MRPKLSFYLRYKGEIKLFGRIRTRRSVCCGMVVHEGVFYSVCGMGWEGPLFVLTVE